MVRSLAIAAALLLSAFEARAQSANLAINACLFRQTPDSAFQLFRYVKDASECDPTTESWLGWNTQGPQGPQGAAGPQGPAGSTGPQGPAGVSMVIEHREPVANLILPGNTWVPVTRLALPPGTWVISTTASINATGAGSIAFSTATTMNGKESRGPRPSTAAARRWGAPTAARPRCSSCRAFPTSPTASRSRAGQTPTVGSTHRVSGSLRPPSARW